MSRCLVVALAATALLSTGCSKTKPDCKGAAVACGDVCVDPSSDNRNCGTCGNACEAGTACSNGVCAVMCATGLVNCGDSCIDPRTDRSHCGATGSCTGLEAGIACADGQLCSAGVCTQTCAASQAACPTVNPTFCADLSRDANNCGACGTTCLAGQQCSGSACACPSARADACGTGASAFCTDFRTDPTNCGSCGHGCASGQLCSAGVCTQTCAASQAACPTVNPTYCAELSRDANNCGACGTTCPAGQQCSGSACACPSARADACGTGASAFCTDFRTDPTNCGSCGHGCASGQLCSAGVCTQTCSTGQTACPTTEPTYCADLTYDANNCGACGTVCPSGTACAGGTCRSSCPAGEYACAGRCIDPASDPVYCGAAQDCSGGQTCRASEACQQGVCTPVARVATPIVGGDPGLTSWAQTVPDEDGLGSVFPGQANAWQLDSDFSLAAGFGWQYWAALQLAVGDVTPSPTLASLDDDWYSALTTTTGLLHLAPGDQRAAEITFLTPRFGTADGVVTATISDAILWAPPLERHTSGYLNCTADSRLVRTVTLDPDQTYTLTWKDESLLLDDLLAGAADQPYGPRYQVVLRDPTTGAVIGDPLFATTATFSSASWRTASFSTAAGNVPAGAVDLSFELRSAVPGWAEVDAVVLSTLVASFDNGDFESGVAPWRFEGGGESRNVRSGARSIGIDPAGATTLAVTRTFYSPPTAPWGRLVDEFRNDGDVPVTTKIVYHTILGASAPGVALDAVGGRWVVGRDREGGARDVGLVFGTGSAYFDPGSPDLLHPGPPDIFFVHDLTVPAHGAVALAHFVVQLGQGALGVDHPTTATDAVCAAITDGFPGEYAQDLEPGVLGRIVNF